MEYSVKRRGQNPLPRTKIKYIHYFFVENAHYLQLQAEDELCQEYSHGYFAFKMLKIRHVTPLASTTE